MNKGEIDKVLEKVNKELDLITEEMANAIKRVNEGLQVIYKSLNDLIDFNRRLVKPS